MRRMASLPLETSSTTSNPSRVSIDASIWRTWSVSSTTMTLMALPISPAEPTFPFRSNRAGHAITAEPRRSSQHQQDGDQPHEGADTQRDRHGDEQQPGRLTDGEEDQRQDD